MKRIGLFIVTNLLVVLVISIVLQVLGVGRFLQGTQLNISSLLVFSLVVGFTGSFISLLMSKTVAKMSTGTQVINPQSPRNAQERFLVQTVHQLAERAQIGYPEVGIYEGPPNAFATGAFKNDSLVAVSTGLLQSMTEEEVTAVLAHEVAHIANGDMVTMTLVQGVMNTFVVFFSRLAAFAVDRFLASRQQDSESNSVGPAYWITSIVFQILFGILASIVVAWFSRHREYRADAGAAQLLGSSQPMVNALKRLQHMESGNLPESVAAFGISQSKGLFELFATHPPLEERIQALHQRTH